MLRLETTTRPLRAAIDGRALGSGWGGEETYLRAMLAGLAEVGGQLDRFPVWMRPGLEPPAEIVGAAGIPVRRLVTAVGPWHYAVRLPRAVRRGSDDVDVLCSTTHAPLRSAVATAFIIGDLSPFHHPEWFPRHTVVRLRAAWPIHARQAAAVLVPSEFTRQDVIERLRVPAERVFVVPPHSLSATTWRDDDDGDVRRAAGIDGPYVLSLGNLHPRKNVGRLIRAFVAARSVPGSPVREHQLVIAGGTWWRDGEEQRLAAAAPPGSVRMLGRVDDARRRVARRRDGSRLRLAVRRVRPASDRGDGGGHPGPRVDRRRLARDVRRWRPVRRSLRCRCHRGRADAPLRRGTDACVPAAARVRPSRRIQRRPHRARRPRGPRVCRLRLFPGSGDAVTYGPSPRDLAPPPWPAPPSVAARPSVAAAGPPPPQEPPPHIPPRQPPRQRPRRSRRRRIILRTLAALLSLVVVLIATAVVIVYRQNHRAVTPLPPPFSLPASTAVPADHLLFDSDRAGNYEIFAMADDGTGIRAITSDPTYDSWWPQLSPDRTHLLFYRSPRGTHDRDATANSLWVGNADGTELHELLPAGAYGWVQQGHAEWSPDGQHLVMFAGSRINPQLWETDVQGRNAKALTSRPGVSLDPSWSPDGDKVAFIACPARVCFAADYEVYVLDLAGGTSTRVTTNTLRDHDPVFSPDGTRLAWLAETATGPAAGVWNVRSAALDGSDLRDVTHDGNINSRPAYSRNGTVIYFHRLVYGAAPASFQIWRVSPDGSGLAPVGAEQPGNNEYPAP